MILSATDTCLVVVTIQIHRKVTSWQQLWFDRSLQSYTSIVVEMCIVMVVRFMWKIMDLHSRYFLASARDLRRRSSFWWVCRLAIWREPRLESKSNRVQELDYAICILQIRLIFIVCMGNKFNYLINFIDHLKMYIKYLCTLNIWHPNDLECLN